MGSDLAMDVTRYQDVDVTRPLDVTRIKPRDRTMMEDVTRPFDFHDNTVTSSAVFLEGKICCKTCVWLAANVVSHCLQKKIPV